MERAYLPSAPSVPPYSTGITFNRTTLRDKATLNDERGRQKNTRKTYMKKTLIKLKFSHYNLTYKKQSTKKKIRVN